MPGGGDREGVGDFGYTQSLTRTLGNFHTFAAGISYISILTGTFQLFYFGFGVGGPAYWWSWPMVFVGQLMVALSFAELAAHYPVAGSIYNWTKRLSNRHVAWLSGWMMVVATIVSISATALAYQLTLPQISSVFQVVGDGTGTSFASNAVLLAAVLITFTTLVNAFGVRLMARINSAGVAIELVAAAILIILLAAHITRGPDVVLETQGTGATYPAGYLGAFLVASLASAYVMYGFDTAASLGEETVDPRRNAPKAILRALIASFIIGGLILLFAMMAVPDLTDPRLGEEGGLQYAVLQTLGSTLGTALLWAVVVAVTVCVLAVHTAGIRMIFAMARDNNLPASSQLARVSPRFGTPILPAVVIGVLAIAILVLNIGQPQIFTLVTSLAIIFIYCAYLLVTVPLLLARLRGKWPLEGAAESGRFGLGRWGLPVNVVAVVWGAAMAINLAWPRPEVYNTEPPYHWYLQWGAVLVVGGAAAIGFAYYWFVQRHKTGTLREHLALVPGVTDVPDPPLPGPEGPDMTEGPFPRLPDDGPAARPPKEGR
ncbi:amino acid permease [Rhodococcus sp. X156]|uniref:APC family permease n=1 Tax=Rhodococcus sp. X156 TaxID=2499145 RepID=UPI001F49AC65|nr:amino acid permease [Rhodococcus sp. X156]